MWCRSATCHRLARCRVCRFHHPVGSAELDRKVDHWPYGHSSGRTRIVREETGTVPGMEQVSRVVRNPEFEWHMEVPPVGEERLDGQR